MSYPVWCRESQRACRGDGSGQVAPSGRSGAAAALTEAFAWAPNLDIRWTSLIGKVQWSEDFWKCNGLEIPGERTSVLLF